MEVLRFKGGGLYRGIEALFPAIRFFNFPYASWQQLLGGGGGGVCQTTMSGIWHTDGIVFETEPFCSSRCVIDGER